MKSKKNVIAIGISFAVFIALIIFANNSRPVYRSSDVQGTEYEVAKVTRVLENNVVVDDEMEGLWRGSMSLELQILSGTHKGELVETENYFSSLYNVRVGKGDKVSVRIDPNSDGTYTASIYNYYRVPYLIAAVMTFLILLMLIGGKKGVKSVVGLLFTVISIIWILLPLSLKGYSPLLVTIFIVLFSNFVCFLLIDGINKKTIVASLGSVAGVLSGALFAVMAQNMMHVTTYQMDEAETLLLISSTTKLQVRDLFLCGILIACMGAVMDVAMSITSAIHELHSVNEKLTAKELFKSGMNIGRDAMGTMSNTLILAFAGNAFNMILMIFSYGVGFQQLMNTDYVAVEIIRAIAGSIGIICTVPIVAFMASYAYALKSRKKK